MKERPTINSDTFEKIFINKEKDLELMASSLTKENINKYKNNITSNPNHKLKYLITMPNDNTLTITNTETNEKININLKKN